MINNILYSEYDSKVPRMTQPNRPDSRLASPSLSSQIHDELLNRIQNGGIGPGDRLVDTGIAQELGVSRMPVREALLRLANDGYVVSTSRGFILSPLTHQDILDIFELRRLLEPRAAAHAARALTDADHAALTVALGQARTAIAAGDVAGLVQANASFRGIWIAALDNRRLAETIGRFADQVQFVRLATLDDARIHRIVLGGLERLHAAYLARDAIAASDATLDFLTAAQHAYSDGLADDSTPQPDTATR